MGSRFRFTFLTVAVFAAGGLGALVVLVVVLVEVSGSRAVDHLAGWATIAGLPLALLGGLLSSWLALFRASTAPEMDVALAESLLGAALERESQVRLSQVLAPAGIDHPVNLGFEKVTTPFKDYGGDDTGDLDGITDYFTSLPRRRLVILGGPGSGKTVLALELQARLLVLHKHSGAHPLPVFVSAAAYDPAKTWAAWLIRHLAQRYLLPEEAAQKLVEAGRILPIIDGVDELEWVSVAALLAELNGFVRNQELGHGGGSSLVITCQEDEYTDVAEPLKGATHVKVRPLTLKAVRSHLQERGIGMQIPDQLAGVLSNPLMLALTDTIYGGREGPAEPIDDFVHLPDRTSVERHLLSTFVTNAYQRVRPGRAWSLEQAERWLALIGSQMRALSTDGYAWRQVAYALPARFLGLLSGAATCLGLFVTLTLFGLTHHVFGERVPLGSAIGSVAAISIVAAIVASLLVAGLNSGSLVFLPLVIPQLVIEAMTGPPHAVAVLAASLRTSPAGPRQELRAELVRRRQGKGSHAANPRMDLIRSRGRSLIRAAAAGVALGVLAVALTLVGVHLPRDATIVFVCYCMLVIVLCAPWGSFQLAQAWFVVRRQLPYRILDFLDDAHARAVLRPAGPRFEFANDAIHAYFGDPARLPEVRKEIGELTKWALANLEIFESYRYVDAKEADIEQAVSSLATDTILAGRPFVADAATRQAVLERVRVRLNELGHSRTAFKESLVAREAPGLGAVIDPSRVISTRTMNDLANSVDRTSSASVGISGIRGIGKSTLIRWLCTERNVSGRLPVLGIYVTAPVEYNARDFLVHLYITLCKTVLADDRFTDHRARKHRSLWRGALFIILSLAGTGLLYHRVIDHKVTATWTHDQGDLWSLAASLLFTGAFFALVSAIRSVRRRRGGGRRKTSLAAAAKDRLQHLRYQVQETTGQTGTVSGPFGLSLGGSRSRQVTENQLTLPELVESYREFAELTVSALQEAAGRTDPVAIGQVRLVVGIDEIDRIDDAEKAEKFLNDIKAIFGIPNCFYLASLSADALANFERRVISTRTAFDTTFDTVKRIGPLELETARQVLESRAIGLPYPFITLCYVLSGGVPRELMRIARDIFDVRNDVRLTAADQGEEGAVACAVIAPRVIAREMESLRQGLMPLATQLNVAGAAGLIGLLDDPEWPSQNTQEDLDRLAAVVGERTLFQDETGNIAAAAKICDGLVAAAYFFLSVNEIFEKRLHKIIAELRRYEEAKDKGMDPARFIHLLARARAAIGVNPTLAVTRVQAVRKHYRLPEIAPLLLSQPPAESANG
jgi:hypothetical protein